MKTLAYLFLALFLACQTAPKEKKEKQNEKQETENIPVIDKNTLFRLSVYIPASEKLSESASKLVETKLTQILTANGIAGEMQNPRFAIVPRVQILSKNVTGTAPTMHANSYQVTFYVGDVRSKTLFASTSVEFKGVGETESEAFTVGFQSLKNTDKALQKMIATGKEKIIAFYNAQCETILNEAQTLATQKKYSEAIAQLLLVPAECKDCFEKAQKAIEPIYKAETERTCNEILAKMKAELGKYEDAKALDIYTQIPQDAPCFKEANAIVQKHLANLKPEEKRKFDLEREKYKDEQTHKIAKIKAIQQVANNFIQNFSLVEYAKASGDNWFW